MRKNFSVFMALGILFSLLLLNGCVQAPSEYIGLDEAKVRALAAAGVEESATRFTLTGLDKQDGREFYAMQFTSGDVKYDYEIDPVTGAILEASTERISASEPDSSDASVSSSESEASSVPAAGSSAQQSSGNSEKSAANAKEITEEVAQDAALSHAGLTRDQVVFLKSKLDWEDGRRVYEVEFYAGNKEYDYEVDASTGEIVKYDYDVEQFTPPASSGQMITAEQAKTLALAKVPGAALSDLRSFEADYDDGRLVYEGEFYYSGTEYEFEIDASTGTILSWESEPIR